MQNDVRDLPASNDGLYRFLGGSPLAVALRASNRDYLS